MDAAYLDKPVGYALKAVRVYNARFETAPHALSFFIIRFLRINAIGVINGITSSPLQKAIPRLNKRDFTV